MPRGAKSKFSAEQLKWLEIQLPTFENAQRREKTTAFWPKMEQAFFGKWDEETAQGIELPVPDDGSAEPAPSMSDEDKILLGKATEKRKRVRERVILV